MSPEAARPARAPLVPTARPDRQTVAIAQAAPEPTNVAASIDKLADFAEQACDEGASLVVFGETWLGGYPVWLDLSPEVGLWDHAATQDAFAELRRSSITVPGPETELLGRLAGELGLVLALGVNERVDAGAGNRTLYNTLLAFDADGRLALHHRKLVPTFTERLVWGPGDGQGLKSVATAAGRLGGLVCWEHWMPLARQALHLSGEDVHLALWPMVKDLHQMASRHYAFEGRCFVLAAGSILRAADLPDDLPPAAELEDDDLVLRGGSAIYGPDGDLVCGPVWDEETLLVAELDFAAIDRAALTLDVTGHYARPDVFEFGIKPSPPRG
jgi:predicted amidohydrolase